MPYIKKAARPRLDRIVDATEDNLPDNSGELNYLLTRIVQRYAKAHGGGYMAWNEVVGALECVKLEAYRRTLAPYEDKKIAENGDVPECIS